MKKVFRNRSAFTGLIIIGVLILVSIFAGFLVPNDPYYMEIWESNTPPQWFEGKYFLGTDDMGRCLFSRIIMGTRYSLFVAGVATGLSLLGGVSLGAIAAYVGGKTDSIIMRTMDLILSFPAILLAIAIVASLGYGVANAMIAIAIVRIPAMARVTRSMVLSIKEEDFVQAAKALGYSHGRILFKHIMINCFAPILVVASLNMGTAITVEAALSFLGLGAQPPIISWGRMLSMGREAIRYAPYMTLYPGLAIGITVMGFNLLGDGLRDIFDPQLKER